MQNRKKAPKRQHWLPCAYLQFFAINEQIQGRRSRVYFTDGVICKIASVSNLAVSAFTYSKKHPYLDNIFHNMEHDIPRIIRTIISGQTICRFDHYGFIIVMFDLNHRNIAHTNRTLLERFNVYQAISRRFFEDIFVDVRTEGNFLRDAAASLEKNWRVDPIYVRSGEKFITCDNPSIIFTEPKYQKPVLVLLPIHPTSTAVAYDKRFIEIIDNYINDDDLGILNGLQINLSVRHCFADHDFKRTPEEWERLKSVIALKKPERGTDGQTWQTGYISVASPFFSRLTFLKRIDS